MKGRVPPFLIRRIPPVIKGYCVATVEKVPGAEAGRRPRADAARNRARLLDAAKAVFAAKGAEASLEAIAREAGVGIGTLYRHFPTRDSLIEAVYRNETDQLGEAARRLAAELPPVPALRAWMLAFVDYMATKQGMTDLLKAMPSGSDRLYAASGAMIREAMAALIGRAASAGEMRFDGDPFDLLRALGGVASLGRDDDGGPAARAMVDILIAGLRMPRA